MRKESSDYYSVERLFESLFPHLSNRFEVRVVRVPYQSRGLLHCVRNLLFTARLRADVVHVTGDIYYCALAIHRRQCVLTMLDLVSLYRLQGVRKRILSLFWYSLPLRWAHFVTAISEETRKQLEREFPASKEKIEVIPCCVDDAFGCNYRSVRTDADTPRCCRSGPPRTRTSSVSPRRPRVFPCICGSLGHLAAASERSCTPWTLLGPRMNNCQRRNW